MLELKNVSFSYGELKVLDNFNLDVKKGECVCLWGKSGCGKTTALRIIMGLEKADSGLCLTPQKISCVFQEDRLINGLTLEKNIKLPLKREQYKKADMLIDKFGLAEFKNTRVSELSGGMKRRATIIRALSFEGDLLILDEAFNGIDAKMKEKIARVIKEEFLDNNKSVILVSHISSDAELLGARIIKM
ncbi:MAG: ABC transporter ATP-binding protein [Clostridia bacterium]|nr:ABC transporter ATP-binding protein [Clostridia bacterium]